MCKLKGFALLALLFLVPCPVEAQNVFRDDRNLGGMLRQFQDEVRAYQLDVDDFVRAPEYPRLADLILDLRRTGIRVEELDAAGPRYWGLRHEEARRAEDIANRLCGVTHKMGDRLLNEGASRDVRWRIDRVKSRSDGILDLTARLRELTR